MHNLITTTLVIAPNILHYLITTQFTFAPSKLPKKGRELEFPTPSNRLLLQLKKYIQISLDLITIIYGAVTYSDKYETELDQSSMHNKVTVCSFT